MNALSFYRDLSFTSISHLPVKHLRLTLEYLFINGTESLKSLPLRLSGLDYGVNRTFPFLKNISVEYPAHCCLVSDQHTLRFGLPSKRAVTGSASKHHQPWKRSSQMFVCLNTISGDLVNSYTPNQSEIFNLTELCSSITHCFGGRCFDNCQAPVMESGLLPIIEIPQIACIQELKPSTTVPIAPTMSSFGISSIVFSTICVTSSPSLYSSSSITPTPTPPPPTTTTQPPMPDCTSGFKFFCQFSSCGAPLCSVCLPSICSRKRSVRVNYEVMSAHLDHRRAVDDQNPDILCSVVAFTSTRVCVTPSPTLSSTPDQLPPSSICSVVLISLAPTVSHTSLCFTVTRTLSPSSSSAYSLTNSLAPSPTHTIHAEETTVEVACSTIETAPMSTPAVIVTSTVSSTEITMVTTVSVTPTPSVDLLIQECEPIPRFPPSYYHLTNQTVSCDPGNDAFNPCNDIFESNVLRTAVWIVILIIIGGNTTVIGVTILYLIIHYRHKQRKSHIMFYLYLNLAFADLLMGFYLLTIASEDLITIGRFSEFAVEWQTGYGCQFAGFCAILSGMMSVYTLLVITIERVYSIRFALESRQLRKRHAIWIMIFGWLLGIFIAALPLPFIGASSYSRVSICLPFETRGPEDIIYLIFILFSTGMGTFIISCSYIYIFYLVAYTARKRGMHRTINNKEEFYLALRMCILVLTNFVCWGPIAFFSITAMCGLPIIGVEDAKVLIVIIFPINSCLNPILYSFSTKTFRQNLLNQLNKCGLFKSHSRQLRAQRSSGAVATSTERITSTDRRGSLMTMLMSISSYGNSRRNSTLSGTSGLSLEEGTAIQNPGFVMSRGFHRPSITSTDSNASSGDEEDRLPMPLPVAYLRQARASQSSLSGLVSGLQAVPEEKECDTQFNVNDNDQVQTETETVIVHRWSMDSTESVNTELKYNKADNEEDEDSFSGKTTKLGVTNRLITEDNTTIFSNPYSGASLSPQLSSKRQATDEVHPSSLN